MAGRLGLYSSMLVLLQALVESCGRMRLNYACAVSIGTYSFVLTECTTDVEVLGQIGNGRSGNL